MFKFDDHINSQLAKHLYLFKYIHPNVITITGLLLNGICLFTLYYLKNKDLTAILLVLRILADNLDGMVARRFNKTSKLGGLLDTFSDAILIGAIAFCGAFYFSKHLIFSGVFGIGCIYGSLSYLFVNNALVTHSNMELDRGIFNKIPLFIYYNTYLVTAVLIFLMYLI